MKKILFVIVILFVSCEKNTEIPLPSNPLITFALPKSIFIIRVMPNPMPHQTQSQVWSITVINSIDFDITEILYRVFDQNNNFIRERIFTNTEITSLFEYVYIPPCTTIVGTRNNDFTDPSNSKVVITIKGVDENQNNVSSSDTVIIQ